MENKRLRVRRKGGDADWLHFQSGSARNTVRAALRSAEPPGYRREGAGSKLDPFKGEIYRLLSDDGELLGQRILRIEGGRAVERWGAHC